MKIKYKQYVTLCHLENNHVLPYRTGWTEYRISFTVELQLKTSTSRSTYEGHTNETAMGRMFR